MFLENNSCFFCFVNPISTRYIRKKRLIVKKVIYAVINMVYRVEVQKEIFLYLHLLTKQIIFF